MSLENLEKRIQAIEDKLGMNSVATKEAETVIEQPKTVIEQPETVTEQPETVIEQPETVIEQPKTVIEQPETVIEQPETDTSAITSLPPSVDAKAAADKAASDKNNTIISLEYADGTSKYKGTVGNLFSMISAKIGQLQSNKGSKDYKDKAAKLAKMLSDFKEPTTTVEKIKSDIIESPLLFGFKNNKIFGGKSKRRSKKSKKSKKTKRR